MIFAESTLQFVRSQPFIEHVFSEYLKLSLELLSIGFIQTLLVLGEGSFKCLVRQKVLSFICVRCYR